MGNISKQEKKELKKQEWGKKLQEEQQKKILINILTWSSIVMILIASFFLLIKASTPSSSTSQAVKLPPVTTADILKGNQKAKVTIIEYADFQCPGCKAEHEIAKELLKQYSNEIRFVYRFFPLTQIHKNAMLSAKTAYAANRQGKFWEMHDILFEKQEIWGESDTAHETFLEYAKSLGLDINKFTKDLSDPQVEKFINSQENAGTQAGVDSTPTFFLNNQEIQISGRLPNLDDFKMLIQKELKK